MLGNHFAKDWWKVLKTGVAVGHTHSGYGPKNDTCKSCGSWKVSHKKKDERRELENRRERTVRTWKNSILNLSSKELTNQSYIRKGLGYILNSTGHTQQDIAVTLLCLCGVVSAGLFILHTLHHYLVYFRVVSRTI